MRKLLCYCDRCAVEADWSLCPSRRNSRFFDLVLKCHGEEEKFLVAATDLVRPRDPSTGKEIQSPLYVIAFEGEQASAQVRVIQSIDKNSKQFEPAHGGVRDEPILFSRWSRFSES
jgi:hypothetical protein